MKVSFQPSTSSLQGAVNGGITNHGYLGGPFVATLWSGSPGYTTQGSQWTTFCVELSETISLNSTKYDVIGHGNQVTASGNTVSDEARWLYYESRHNPSLLTKAGGGYYSAAIGQDNADLQNAIWFGVDPGPWPADPLGSNPNLVPWSSLSANAKAWYGLAQAGITVAPAVPGGEWFTVLVLNPGKDNTSGAQNQSCLYENTENAVVPEPASLLIWTVVGAGAAGMALMNRRRRRSGARWSTENRQAILGMIDSKLQN
jgi:hypothetical protein